MTDQNIVSQDVNLKRLFQDFYRVPSYQREYVWGEQDGRGEGGEQVDEYLADIFNEYQNATSDTAPEYFIGTIVVCREKDEVFDLIDGQQRTTTSYLTICALRDALTELGETPPEEMKNQIASTSVDWQGETTARYRLDLQYEDAAESLANTLMDKLKLRVAMAQDLFATSAMLMILSANLLAQPLRTIQKT